MAAAADPQITRLLEAVQQGDRAAFERLYDILYEELRTLARRERRRARGHDTLNTTALVHEAYLKLADGGRANWESRAHFTATAARAMRHILIDHARRARRQKRGAGAVTVPLESLSEAAAVDGLFLRDDPDLLLAFDAAFRELQKVNERQCRIVECRIFGGMTVEETAEALGISTATVSRGWAVAKARLHRAISGVA